MTDAAPHSQTPETSAPAEHGHGTLEQGLAGNYQLTISDVVKEAWEKVSGNKSALWIGLAIYIVAQVAISFVLWLFIGGDAPVPDAAAHASTPGENLADTLANLLTLPLGVGLMLLGVAVASGREANPTSVFSWYDKFLKLVLTWILMAILVLIGTLLLVLPGIYLAVSYQLALPLVADKGLGPWEAMETSRKIVSKKWFTFFGLGLVAGLATAVSVLLLAIPLIWVLPACLIGIGIIYRDAIGVESTTLQKVSN